MAAEQAPELKKGIDGTNTVTVRAFLSNTLTDIIPSCNVLYTIPTLCYFELAAEEVSDNVALPLMIQQMLKGSIMRRYSLTPLLIKSSRFKQWGPTKEEFNDEFKAQLCQATGDDPTAKTDFFLPSVNILTKYHSDESNTRFWGLTMMPDGTLVTANICLRDLAVCLITPDGDCFETSLAFERLRGPVVLGDDLVGFVARESTIEPFIFIVFRVIKVNGGESEPFALKVVEEKRYELDTDRLQAATLLNPDTVAIVGETTLVTLNLKTGEVTNLQHSRLAFGMCLFRSPAAIAQGATPQSCLHVFPDHANCEIVVLAAYTVVEFYCVTHEKSLGTIDHCGTNIVHVALLPNGLVAVAATVSKVVYVCDPSKMTVVDEKKQLAEPQVCALAVLPGGKYLAAVSDRQSRANSNCFMFEI